MIKLNDIAAQYKISDICWNIHCSDGLLVDKDSFFDFVVGNPPYIAYKDLNEKERADVKKNFKSCSKGKFDYSYAFIEKGLNLLKPHGKMIMISPSNMFKTVDGKAIRELIKPHLTGIINCSRDKIFDKVLTSPSITVYQKEEQLTSIKYKIGLDKKFNIIDKSTLIDKWIFDYSNNGTTRFGDYFKVCNSIATLSNKIFIHDVDKNGQVIVDCECLEEGILKIAKSPRSEKYSIKRNTHGTTIVIRQLRDKWTEKSIELLKGFLSRTYNSDLMTINIIFNGITETISKYFSEPKLGINCLSYFYLEYDATATILKYSIYSDEFNDEAAKYTNGKKLKFQEDSIDISNQLSDDELDVEPEEIPKLIKEIGSFNARIFFSMKGVSDVDKEKFCYKHKELLQRYQEGIILYRNAFSIASYEGKKDWLELGKRSRKSPAAATHETGSWRIRENQVSGYVQIDKQENNLLRDLSNRQGIEENIYYKLFVKILQFGISEFESYRQKIIRDIDKKNAKRPIKATPYIDKAVKTPGFVHNLDASELNGLIKEIQQVKKEQDEDNKRNKETEEKFKYDIRILNMLSTIGLRASSIAHEMQNDRNNISENYNKIVEALKEYDLWDILNLSKNTQFAYKNVPRLLENNRKINEKIIRFMDTMLSNTEKGQFHAKEINIINILIEIKSIWERDYSWVNITISNTPVYFITAEDVIKVLIDNLILNSIQQNESNNNLKIAIEVELIAAGVLIKYKDEGVGLPKKYKNNPRKILDVHESSRKNGHGLGMWIINNTLIMSGGRVEDIPIRDGGFEIQMIIGDKL